MERRDAIALVGAILGGAVATPIATCAQQPSGAPVVGVLAPHLFDGTFSAFAYRLRELGYEDLRNLRARILQDSESVEREGPKPWGLR